MANYNKRYAMGARILHNNLIDSLCPTFNHKLLNRLPHEEYLKEQEALNQQNDSLLIAADYPSAIHMTPIMHPLNMNHVSNPDKVDKRSIQDMATFVTSTTENLATGFKETEIMRIGSNNKLYLRNPGGNVFKGNSHVSTTKLSVLSTKYDLGVAGQKLGKVAEPVGLALDAVSIGKGIMEDDGRFGCNAQRATAGATGKKVMSKAGAKTGAKFGAAIGAKIGAIGGLGIGAAPGAAIGAVVGGLAGGFLGGKYGGKYSKKAYDEISYYQC